MRFKIYMILQKKLNFDEEILTKYVSDIVKKFEIFSNIDLYRNYLYILLFL